MRMSTKILQIAGFFALLVCCYGKQHPSCQIWKTMANHLSNQPGKQMTCFANDTNPCTSLRCSGTYKYRSWMLDSDGIEVDYCFGMRLNHCDNPVSMDIYLIVPPGNPSNRNISYYKRISHNTQLQIPGFSFNLKSLGTVDIFLYFHMVRDGSFVNLKIIAKVRITVGRMVMWPASMQKEIVPTEQIPVPPCVNHSLTTPATLTYHGSCHPPTWHPPTTAPGVSTTTESPFVTAHPKSLTYNRACTEGQSICGTLEMCDLVIGKCICNPDFPYNKKLGACVAQNHLKQPCSKDSECGKNEMCNGKVCMCKKGFTFKTQRQMCFQEKSGEVPTTPPQVIVTPQQHVAPNTNAPSNAPAPSKTPIIAGAVVGGVVFLVLVALLVFFLVRRARSPYENREMLLSDDTDGIM